jgi:glycosyltransferase involved in cell wall biosynthesis
MQILIVSPEYPPHSLGGGGIMVKNLAEELNRQKVQTILLAGYYPVTGILQSPFYSVENKNIIEWLPLLPSPNLGFQLKTIMPPNLLSLLKMTKIFLNNNYDLVHIHGYGHFICDFASVLCWLFHKKYVLTIHGFPKEPIRRGSYLKILFNIYSKSLGLSLLRRAKMVVAVSNSVKLECQNYVDNNRVKVIYNTININDFKKLGEIDVTNIKNKYKLINKKIILCIGRITINKGFQFVIESLPIIKNQITNVHLIIIGKDEGYGYLSTLKKIAYEKEVESHVSFLENINDEEKIELISTASVIAIPSIIEPFGLVALEAMASGKPIVASNVDGLREILDHDKYSILVNAIDTKQLASSLLKFLNDETSIETANVQERLKKFDLTEMAKKYINLYHEIAN